MSQRRHIEQPEHLDIRTKTFTKTNTRYLQRQKQILIKLSAEYDFLARTF